MISLVTNAAAPDIPAFNSAFIRAAFHPAIFFTVSNLVIHLAHAVVSPVSSKSGIFLTPLGAGAAGAGGMIPFAMACPRAWMSPGARVRSC